MNNQYANVSSIYAAQRLNENNGMHFFSPNAMRFFSCRIHSDLYRGCVFVTSEKSSWDVRKYTVRAIKADGGIETVGEFQGYETRSQAHTAAQNFAKTIR